MFEKKKEFRIFSQGDLSVDDYCRQFKRKADDLRDLGQPISEATLVLNIIRGLNERFTIIGIHMRRTTPLPTFLQVRDELRLEELTMAKTPPATALTALGGSGGSKSAALPHQQQPQPPPQLQQQGSGGNSSNGYPRGKCGGTP